MRVLEAFNLYRFYHAEQEETLALRGVSLYVEEGELVAVMGPSGCGKTTLLACLAGLDEPDGGYVMLNGSRLTRRPEAERAARRGTEIGILLQSDNLIGHLSIKDNIRLQMRLVRRLNENWLKELISLVGLEERQRAYPSQLSGGEAARAGLAVALAAAPKVLLADEPTGEVDVETEEPILRLFEARRANGDATLVATHSRALAERADRIINLLDGRVIDG
jgi:putative ABC transport system ATP-binding protein